MFSCSKPSPQLPANKANNSDSLTNNLIKLNEELIENEDSLINELVNRKYADFNKSNLGFWYKLKSKPVGDFLKNNDICSVNYNIYTLEEDLIFSKKETITIGKKEIITGIEECLKLMNRGDEATIIIPWYLAYGLKGNNAEIGPYTSIIVRICVINNKNE